MRAYDKDGRAVIIALYGFLPFFARIFIRLRLVILPLEEVESVVPSGMILDVGCGYGLVAHYLAYKDSRRTVIGIDHDPLLIFRANQITGYTNRVRFIQKDAEIASLEKYNGVVFCDILHHLSPHGQEHILRVSKESLNFHGRLIIKDIEKEQSVFYYWNLFHDRVMRLSGATHHRSADEWAEMVRGLGLRVVEQRHFRHLLYHHILIVAEYS